MKRPWNLPKHNKTAQGLRIVMSMGGTIGLGCIECAIDAVEDTWVEVDATLLDVCFRAALEWQWQRASSIAALFT